MPPVGSPDAPYPPRPGEAPRDHARELEAELDLLHQALDEARGRLRDAEFVRDAEARNRAAADAEIMRQRGEAAEMLGRVRWLERALTEAQHREQHQHEQLQQLAGGARTAIAEAQRTQQEAAARVAAAEQEAAARVTVAEQEAAARVTVAEQEAAARIAAAEQATIARIAIAEQEAREATDAAARYVAQADARWAELVDEATIHASAAEELRSTVAVQRDEIDAIAGPLNDEIAQLESALTETTADLDLARRECVELEAELNRLLFRPSVKELAVEPQLLESSEPLGASDYPVSLAPDLDAFPWQRDALAAWAAADHRGVIESVSGADQRRLAQWAIARALDVNLKVLVLVATADRAEQWHDELREALPINRVGKYLGRLRSGEFDVVVATADAAAKESIFGFASNVLLIADEVEDCGTAELSVALDETFDWRLGLTALYERDDHGVTTYLTPYFGDVVFRLGYERAAEESVIADFDLALIGVSFTEVERAAYDETSQQVHELAAKLVSDFAVPVEDFAAEVEELARGFGRHARSAARTYQKAVAKRDEVLSRAAAKDVVARTLIHLPGAAQALVFSTATVGNAALVGAQQGANFGIALSASGSKREMAQRLGRLTGSGPEGSRRRLAVVYVEGTVEDDRCAGNVTYLADVTPCAHRVGRFDNTMLDELADFLS
jgi:RNA polymerase primary sigma factor